MFDYKNAEKILEAEDVVVKFNLRGKTLTAIRGIPWSFIREKAWPS